MTLASLPNALSSLLSDQVDGLMLMHLSSSLWDASPEQGVAALHLSQAPSMARTSHKLCGGALGCTEPCIPRPTGLTGLTGHHHEAELITTGHYHWLLLTTCLLTFDSFNCTRTLGRRQDYCPQFTAADDHRGWKELSRGKTEAELRRSYPLQIPSRRTQRTTMRYLKVWG